MAFGMIIAKTVEGLPFANMGDKEVNASLALPVEPVQIVKQHM